MPSLPLTRLAWPAFVCAGLLLPMSGDAQELRLSGYGTAGLSWDDRSDMAPTRDISQLPRDVSGGRAGYSTGPNWRLDSHLGLQLDYRLAAEFELASQLVL